MLIFIVACVFTFGVPWLFTRAIDKTMPFMRDDRRADQPDPHFPDWMG